MPFYNEVNPAFFIWCSKRYEFSTVLVISGNLGQGAKNLAFHKSLGAFGSIYISYALMANFCKLGNGTIAA